MLKCAIIINKNARKNKSGGLNKDKVYKILKNSAEIFETWTIEEARSAITYIKELNFDIVVGSGGDGTHHSLLTEICKVYGEDGDFPIYLPLRGGTMNFAAPNIPVKGSQIETIQRLKSFLEKVEHRLDIPKDMLKRNRILKLVEKERKILRYGFAVIMGLPYKITKLYYASGTPSPSTAFNITTSIIGGYVLGSKSSIEAFQPIDVDIEIDGEKYPYKKCLLLVASVFPKMVLWFEPFYKEDKWKDGYYLLVFSEPGLEAIKRIRALSKGRLRMEKSYNDLAENTVVRADSGYAMDGEVFERNSPFEIKILKGPAIKFLRI